MTISELKAALKTGQRIVNVEIDKTLAAAILDDNPQNRPTKIGHTRKLARLLKDGLWNPDLGGSIAFSPEGRLTDGQHRLRAVVLSGVSIIVDVRPNQKTTVGLDENASRSVADHLALQGVDDASIVATATKMLFKAVDTDGNPGAAHVLGYYHEHAAFLQECAAKARAWLADISPARQIMRAGELAGVRALAVRTLAYKPEKIDDFLASAMSGGSGEDDSSPAARLFKFLNSKNEKAVASGRRVALTLDALNQHITGKTRRLDIVRKAPKARRPKVTTTDTTTDTPILDEPTASGTEVTA